ncbi:MAG: YncE family protein [Candidatus Sulfotelmatobacter sp.]
MSARGIVAFAAAWLIAISWAPRASAQSASGMLLVLEKDDRMLAIVDPASMKVVGRVATGEDPHEVVASEDGRFAYISNYGAFRNPQHTISVVDLAERKALPAVDLGALLAPHGLDLAGGKVYFTAEGSKAIGRYDPASGKVDWVLGIGQNRTHMLMVAKDESRIFTSNVNSDSIGILERDKNADASGWTETYVSVGKGPEGFDVSPDGKELWAANSHDGTVSVIDVASKKVVQTFAVPTKFANRVKFTHDGKMVLISDLGTGDLVVLDAAARKEIKRVRLGKGIAGILISPDGARAYVAASPDRYIAVVDLKTLAMIGKIETGRGPDGMAWVVGK